MLPDYTALTMSFGFAVPESLERLLVLAWRYRPENHWDAFESASLMYMGSSLCNPAYDYPGHDYMDTPVEVYVFGWTGCDGAHWGFVVEDLPQEPAELPIAYVYPNYQTRLVGRSISEFLSLLIVTAMADIGADDDDYASEVTAIRDLLVGEFEIDDARNEDAICQDVLSWRIASGAYPTVDGIGVTVPDGTIDRAFLDALVWREGDEPDPMLMRAGRERFAAGEIGTALVIAKNYRHLFAYSDWKRGKRIIRETADLLQSCYRALGREHLARKMRVQTEWAVAEVL